MEVLTTPYDRLQRELRRSPRTWVVTGVAGFIGSHLMERLLALDQRVTGIDDLSTGSAWKLDEARERLSAAQRRRFRFIHADLADRAACRAACKGAQVVLHEAALGSVPRSLEAPAATHHSNLTAFVRLLDEARASGAGRVVYASSTSVYGDTRIIPQREEALGRLLSPYAVTKRAAELYADVFGRCYGLQTIGLRYFNVFGPRQDPGGPYAAVIPRWILGLLNGDPVTIYGDGKTFRDFCYVENVVQANLLAGATRNDKAVGRVFNVAAGRKTTLLELLELLRERIAADGSRSGAAQARFEPRRPGDIQSSLASIEAARRLLGYRPAYTLAQGLGPTLEWYRARARAGGTVASGARRRRLDAGRSGRRAED